MRYLVKRKMPRYYSNNVFDNWLLYRYLALLKIDFFFFQNLYFVLVLCLFCFIFVLFIIEVMQNAIFRQPCSLLLTKCPNLAKFLSLLAKRECPNLFGQA